MHRTFTETINDMRGLINQWSAPSGNADRPQVLLAVSGGIDSMCMAELFASMEDPVDFAVAHCNFCLRGEESDADEALVTAWAEKHGVRMHRISFDTKSFAHEKGISIEMAARDLRYAWFAGLCREHGYSAVAVAHNANDNAETMILNILRGSGLRGLHGMSEISPLPYPDSEGILLVRPLLGCTRKQIEGYAHAHGTAYREDSTNASSDYKRNRIRNEVFPIFAGINPSFVRTLNREMAYFKEAAEITEDYCNGALAEAVRKTDGTVEISTSLLLANRHWKYLLYHALEPYGFNSSVLASIENLLASGRTISGKSFESASHMLLTERDRLIVTVRTDSCQDDMLVIENEGTFQLGDQRFKVEVIQRTEDMNFKVPPGEIILDASRLKFPFIARRWRQGDRMIPFGMRGKKKISDIFADLKYGHKEKNDAILIEAPCSHGCGSGNIAGILGVRIDDRYKVRPDTASVIRIHFIDKI